MGRGCRLTSLAALAVIHFAAASSSAASRGSLDQPPGMIGCVSLDGVSILGPDTCGKAKMSDTTDVVLSPDAKFAYSVGYGSPQALITIFKRNVATGGLAQLTGKAGCISQDGGSAGVPDKCRKGRAIDSGDRRSLALSADGRFLYDASQDDGSMVSTDGAIAVFKRNPKNGKLIQLPGRAGCVSTDGESNEGPGTCAVGRAMEGGIASVVLSPDQKNLYGTTCPSHGDHPGIAIFKRNPKSGRISQLTGNSGCITEDGATQTSISGCAKAPNLSQVFEIGFAEKFVYAPNREDDLVAVMSRLPSGALKPVAGKAGCINDSGAGALGVGTCNKGKGFNDVERVVVSRDARFLYFNGYSPDQIAFTRRNQKTGAFTRKRASRPV